MQVLSEYLQLLDSLSVLSAIQEMSRGVEIWLGRTLQKLDSLLLGRMLNTTGEDVEDNPMAVEVDKSDIFGLTWMKVPWTNQLAFRIKDGLKYKFIGFRDQDVISLTNFIQNSCGLTTEEKQLSISGKNWGKVDLNGNMLSFLVGSKQAFEVSLADVSQTQLQGKNDVILEFHVDDTTGANEKDSLMEISFQLKPSYVFSSHLSFNVVQINPGQLKVHPGGILWKKQGGGKAVEVDKSDISGLTWMKVPRTNQLAVRIKDGLKYKFTGFRDQDVISLTNFFQNSCGLTIEEKQPMTFYDDITTILSSINLNGSIQPMSFSDDITTI
ncbi:unnamed protein product [Lactuca saligna]|uniref:FACT complex subunit SSRP1 n=1 Tax=Lactuca saligna TaxID=75948 RepID=A0AA36EF83_LACSI|nr:unnamed protein product [Lactuca saligna]